jgi:hypothetical protein
MRCHDLRELARKHVAFQGGFFRIEIHFTKSIRCAADGVELRIPTAWLPLASDGLVSALMALLQSGGPNELLFGEVEASVVNAAIRRTCVAMGVAALDGQRRYPTTYTFRRSFVQQIEKRFTNRTTGLTDWNSVTKYTLHQTERCVRANYVARVSDPEPSSI